MFSTFSANPNSTESPTKTSTAARPKRNQVARACDSCRLNRIKCDDRQPCDNCRQRGSQCSNSNPSEAYPAQTASREIQRLRNRVRDLQAQLKKANEHASSTAPEELASSSASTASGPIDFANTGKNLYNAWEGVAAADERTGRAIYYGPLSSSYLVTRMTRYLCKALNRTTLDFPFPALISQVDDARPVAGQQSLWDSEVADLSRAQEEHFLVLLWQSFHCICPVLSEGDFGAYYESLWSDTIPGLDDRRKPSALVDSLLAVCMQYGSTFLVTDDESIDSEQATHTSSMAYGFYQRSQRLLMNELEAPSIASLQSHIYSVIYLSNASLLNSAHATLGVAIRTAQALRLHLRPLDGTPPEERELHLRIWWSLYQLDTSLSMALDRPPLLDWDDVACPLPSDHEGAAEAGSLSGTALPSSAHQPISWLSFHVQQVKLTVVARRVQAAFKAECARLLSPTVQNIYGEPAIIESLAGFVGREMRTIYHWLQGVPQPLKTERKDGREPFSTDRTPLSLDPTAPLWLQRQRLLLEINYHHFQIATLRSFVRFPPRASLPTPLCDSHNISCLNHAMMLTNLLHQVLSETDLLRGWRPVVQYQWDAMVCILAFVLANPVCPPTPAGRRCLQTAIHTLDLMGQQYAVARNAAEIGREIARRVEWLVEQFRSSLVPGRRLQPTPPSQSPADLGSMAPPWSTPSATPGLTESVLTEEHWQALMTNLPVDIPLSFDLDNGLPGQSIITPPHDVISPTASLSDDVLLGQWPDFMSGFVSDSAAANKTS
ncbi:Zn(II)2Cys6 transcription factor [Aspergillus affinis]|uniref:Zn(II)2Cys6 transcription factor n=1 Tax=Aspergillus affinis TaxID=1070780 RepID=UPI0022FE4D2E|nr:uncharacterized protein KD926_006844 [Aspergillus affinis]KAI9041448.1 hypothetical protein KD926_006844 [Aspergillus affinis]